MLKLIKASEYVEVTKYELRFDKGNGYGASFDCDSQGNVDVSKLHPAGQANYADCMAKLTGEIVEIDCSYRSHAIRQCRCGAHITFYGRGSDEQCDDCGQEYNSAGQALAPRSQWGEETGETFGDYYLNDSREDF